MAISKILHLNPCKRSEGLHLKQGIAYITRNDKTSDGFYVGAVNCPVDKAYECMRSTKEVYGKTDKRQAYHLIISFEEGETNPDTAFEVVSEFVNRYLKDNYEAVYSVHNDTDHIHGHIIWNSVRFTDGYKYRYEKGDWENYIQPLVNEICEKHGLGILDPKKKASKDKEWDVSKNGPFVWNEQIKRDVDACILRAADFDMFIQLLEEKDYQVKLGKYLSVKPKGMERYRRLKTLGDEYSEENIRKRIVKEAITRYRPIGIASSPRVKRVSGKLRRKKLTGLQKQYFAMLYRLGKIKKRSYSNYYQYKEDVKKLKLLQRQYLFLSNYDIKTTKDLDDIQEQIKAKIKTTNQAKKVLMEENEKYIELFKAVQTVEKEKTAATLYKLGDEGFKSQNQMVEAAKEIIKEFDMTYKEAEALNNHYQSLIDECDRTIKKLRSDMKISYSLKKDIEYRRQEKIASRHDVDKEREEKKTTSRHDVGK